MTWKLFSGYSIQYGAKTSECYYNTETVLHFQVTTLASTSLGDQEHFVNLLVLYQCCRAKSRY